MPKWVQVKTGNFICASTSSACSSDWKGLRGKPSWVFYFQLILKSAFSELWGSNIYFSTMKNNSDVSYKMHNFFLNCDIKCIT